MIWSGISGQTLTLRGGGYWDYDPLIDTRLRPLHIRFFFLSPFFEEEGVRCTVASFMNCMQHSLI
jgi:hypothetical protein